MLCVKFKRINLENNKCYKIAKINICNLVNVFDLDI